MIELKDSLIYVQKGETPDFASFVLGISSDYYDVDADTFYITTDFSAQTGGVYSVHYYVQDTYGNEGHTVLIVVVEE